MKKLKHKTGIVFIAIIVLLFITANIIWINFSLGTKKLLANAKYEMILDEYEGVMNSQCYKYYDKDSGLGYNLWLPKYLNFKCRINISCTLNQFENNGKSSCDEDYQVTNNLIIKPFKKYSYQFMIGKTNDDNGYSQDIILNSIYVDKDLAIKDVYESSVTSSRQEIEKIYYDAYEKVEFIHNSMIDFFNSSLNGLW